MPDINENTTNPETESEIEAKQRRIRRILSQCKPNPNIKIRRGMTFGRYVTLKLVRIDVEKVKYRYIWLCRCNDCGTEREIEARCLSDPTWIYTPCNCENLKPPKKKRRNVVCPACGAAICKMTDSDDFCSKCYKDGVKYKGVRVERLAIAMRRNPQFQYCAVCTKQYKELGTRKICKRCVEKIVGINRQKAGKKP